PRVQPTARPAGVPRRRPRGYGELMALRRLGMTPPPVIGRSPALETVPLIVGCEIVRQAAGCLMAGRSGQGSCQGEPSISPEVSQVTGGGTGRLRHSPLANRGIPGP